MDQNQNTMNNNPEAGERTFTQDDVNRILSKRIAEEKAKSDAALAEKEQLFAERERELANREALVDLKDQLKEKGLPAELLPVLNVQDKAALKTALDALQAYIDEKANAHKEYKVIPNILPKGSHDTADPMQTKLRKAMHLD